MHWASKSVNVFDGVATLSSGKAHALGLKVAGVVVHLSKWESDLQTGASHISKRAPLFKRE